MMTFSGLVPADQQSLLKLLVDTTQSGITHSSLNHPSANYTGAGVFYHPAVSFLINKNFSLSEAITTACAMIGHPPHGE